MKGTPGSAGPRGLGPETCAQAPRDPRATRVSPGPHKKSPRLSPPGASTLKGTLETLRAEDAGVPGPPSQ